MSRSGTEEPVGADGADGATGADGPDTADERRLIASLGRRARSVNLARVVRLLALLDAAEDGALDEPGRHEAENLAHQVVGSAGTFGYPAASVDAGVVEEWFAGDPPGSTVAPGVDAGGVRATLVRLRTGFESPPQP